VKETQKQFADSVEKHSSELGINPSSGELLTKEGTPISGTDFRVVVSRMLKPDLRAKPSTRVEQALVNKIYKHPTLGPEFQELKYGQKGQGASSAAKIRRVSSFRPTTWTRC
jgi:hypothetical protein